MRYVFVETGSGDIERENFWELNPQIKYISPFAEVYASDTSQDKQKSSRLMWSIWLWTDPDVRNKVWRQAEEVKYQSIKRFNPEFDIYDPEVKKLVEAYEDRMLTPAAREFLREHNTFVQRCRKLASEEYRLDEIMRDAKGQIVTDKTGKPIVIPGNAKQLDEMRKMTPQIASGYLEIYNRFLHEQGAQRKVRGGGVETYFEEEGLMPLDAAPPVKRLGEEKSV
ncbi:MAG: hypothetical protein KatS3mg054_0048 [Chloroflexus sp.]|nr:MAG: hypothetical protein KatS3mg054_0048 [Chloroflexus sp.]